MRGRLLFLTTLLLALALGTAAPLGAASKAPDTSLSQAAKACALDKSHLSDKNTTLTINTEGEEDFSGDTYDEAKCVFNKLKMPNFIREQVAQTRALDGIQKAHWAKLQ